MRLTLHLKPLCLFLFASLLWLPTCFMGQFHPEFRSYESCTFPDGLAIVDVSPLAPGVLSRPVRTRRGELALQLTAGRRVMFAYPNTDFYANVKVELLPEKNYAQQKQLLMDGFDYTLASSPDNSRNYDLASRLNGMEVQGLDRTKLDGGVLGVYLLFDDPQHLVTTLCLLNQDPARRKFQSLTEYALLRDKFLKTYTACIHGNLAHRTP